MRRTVSSGSVGFVGADLTFQPAKRKELEQREKATATQSRAKLALALRSALQHPEARFVLRWALRLTASERGELAPIVDVFNTNAMTMAERAGEVRLLTRMWDELGKLARTERDLMEQEDHDERSTVHTN